MYGTSMVSCQLALMGSNNQARSRYPRSSVMISAHRRSRNLVDYL